MITFDELAKKSQHDKDQWYKGCIVLDQDKNLFYIDTISSTDNNISLIGAVYKNGWVSKRAVIDKNSYPKWDFSFPEMGNINVTSKDGSIGYVMYMSRIPNRQWKRGFILSNVFTLTPSDTELRLLRRVPRSLESNLHSDIILNIFNKTYYDAKTAIDMIMNGKALSVAISKEFSIKVDVRSDKLLLIYKTFYVGYINNNKAILNNKCNFLEHSLRNYMEVSYAKD